MKGKLATHLVATALLVLSGYCYGATVAGSDVLDVNSDESRVFAYDTGVVNVYEGADVSFLYAYDNSHVNVYGGAVSWLELYDTATARILKGEFSFLELNVSARATIIGSDFVYSEGRLEGMWSDGTAFSFWALNMNNDTGASSVPTDILPAGITLQTVPVPPAVLLMFTALLPLSIRLRTKS